MSSRDNNQTTTHRPLLSSLVIRPAESSGGGGGGGGGVAGSDYERGEVSRDPPPYSRSDRYESHGYRMRAGSVSPVRRRDANHRFSSGFEPSIGTSRTRGFGNGREPGRYFRDHSPHFGRGKFSDRGYHHPSRGPVSFRDEGLPRNNPNVQPREGDWICSNPACKNLNFARRDHCNKCNRPRYARSSGSPRRGYPGPTFPPRQRAPLDHSPPRRIPNGGYNRSPSRIWPRDLRPPPVHEVRFPDPLVRSDRQEYSEDDPRYRYGRPLVLDWGPHRDGVRNSSNYLNERRGFGRRMLSPPPPPVPPPHGGGSGASHIIRDRSRSPARGGAQSKDYHHRDVYMNNRRRDDHRRGGGGGGGGGGGRGPF